MLNVQSGVGVKAEQNSKGTPHHHKPPSLPGGEDAARATVGAGATAAQMHARLLGCLP